MSGPAINTSIGIHLQIAIFQLLFAAEKMFGGDSLLPKIIEYCVSEKTLGNFTAWGLNGRGGHIKMIFSVNYADDGAQFNIDLDSFEGDVSPDLDINGGGESPSRDSQELCRIWSQAIDWFMKLCTEKNLRFWWTVYFLERRTEMCQKFGLVPTDIVDHTDAEASHTIPNTVTSRVAVTAALDPNVYPDQE